MLRLAIYLLVFLLPSIFVGWLCVTLFPHIGSGTLKIAVVCLIMLLFALYVKKANEPKYAENSEEAKPTKKTNFWVAGIALFVLSIMGASIAYSMNKSKLYVENGTDRAIDVTLKYEGKHTIAPGSHELIEVAKGEDELRYDGKLKTLAIAEAGRKYVFNIEHRTNFALVPITYESKSILHKSSSTSGSDLDARDIEFFSGEFFDSKADYVYDAPDEIKTHNRLSGRETKKLLMKIGADDAATDSVTTGRAGTVDE